MTSRERRSLAAIAATGAALAALMAPGVAGAETRFYPAGGSTFTGGAQGWVGAGEACGPVSGSGTCSMSTEYVATEGNPAGSINSRASVLLNVGGLLKGETTWTSPNFTLPEGSPTRSAAVALDRRLDSAVVSLGPESTYRVGLVDRSNGSSVVTLFTETVDETDDAFERSTAPVAAGALVPGRTYAITIRTTTSTRIARLGVLGDINTRYDNVSLSVEDSRVPVGLSPSATVPWAARASR